MWFFSLSQMGLVSNRWNYWFPFSDRFLYFLNSKFTIKPLTTDSQARWGKQSKNNEKHGRLGKTMAIDQAFGGRGGISPIRFISFPAALTFPFAQSNWQNKILVRLSSLSSTTGNHSYMAPLTPSVSSEDSSWQRIEYKQNTCLFAEWADHRAFLQTVVTHINHIREGYSSIHSFSSHRFQFGYFLFFLNPQPILLFLYTETRSP